MGAGWTDTDLENIENGNGFVWQSERFNQVDDTSKVKEKALKYLLQGPSSQVVLVHFKQLNVKNQHRLRRNDNSVAVLDVHIAITQAGGYK